MATAKPLNLEVQNFEGAALWNANVVARAALCEPLVQVLMLEVIYIQ